MPGAVMSGLMMSCATVFGPRELNCVVEGAHGKVPSCLLSSRAVAPAVEAMYDLIARPGVLSTCTVGTKCGSLIRSPASLVLVHDHPCATGEHDRQALVDTGVHAAPAEDDLACHGRQERA